MGIADAPHMRQHDGNVLSIMNVTLHSPGPLQTDSVSGLSFRLGQPAPAAPTRLLVLLHGVGGDETSLLDLATGVHPDTLVVLVRGILQFGDHQYAWFRVTFTATGPHIAPDEADQSRIALIELVKQLQRRYGVSARHTVVAGFSQGGILSASVALTSPESLGGFGLLAGRILPEVVAMIANQDRVAHLQGFIGHGEHDNKLPVHWAHRSDQLLLELGIRHAVRLYPIDHSISESMQADFVAWLNSLG